MQQSDVLILFGHLYWIRDRILDAADEEGVPLTDPRPATIRDLRTTLIHELDVEWSWRRRLQQADRTDFPRHDGELDPEDFPTIDSIRESWREDEAEMRAWLATLSDDELAGPCGVERMTSHPLWFHLQHVYTHGLQQFSDAATLLSRADASPGEIDFLEYAADLART
ncbi:MAG TPA: DinB family protein [Candidatus Limnocylindrales bacterium]|nr:DinB family protein [Candidatus Limnocylindrales bacterium]